MTELTQSDDSSTNSEHESVFDRLFGADTPKQDTSTHKTARSPSKRGKAQRVSGHSLQANGGGRRSARLKPPKARLKPRHLKFVAELIKNPAKPAACYSLVYPEASPKTAYRRAHELMNRPDVKSELLRQQNVRVAKASMTRARMEEALGNVFAFDFRRFYQPAFIEVDGVRVANPKAGEPLAPHELDPEAAQVIESYEKSMGKYGAKIKFRTTPRLGAAELLAKLKGWVKDDGRPPIVANFNFDFGPKPVAGQRLPDVEAVPAQFYGAMGLRDASIPAKPVPKALDENGDPVPSSMPAGYEPARGVRIKSRGSELAADLDANLTRGGAT